MADEIRSAEEIERSLHGTRQRIEDRFAELSRRVHARTDVIPSWALGAGAGVLLYLLRRPLLRVLRSTAKASAPIVVPFVIGKVMERRRGGYGGQSGFEPSSGFSGDPSYSP